MIKVRFDDKKFRDTIRKIGLKGRNLRPLMARYYGETYQKIIRNFRFQGSYGDILSGTESRSFKRWPKLGNFQRSSRMKRGTGTAMLQDSGKLRLSVGTVRQVTNTKMVIGTNLIYAAMMHFGGIIRPVKAKALAIPWPGVDKKPRDYENTFITKGIIFQSLPSGGFVPLFILKKKVDIPARPYITVGPKTLDKFMVYAADYLTLGSA